MTMPRRSFLSAAAVSTLGLAVDPKNALTPSAAPTRPIRRTACKPLKQIDAGVLNVGYAEDGPADGPAVVLLHGWPYDIHSYVDVAPRLAAKGYRVIVPYLRGYGTTRFLSADTMRNGQQAAIAADTIALMDTLKIQQAIIGGFDWGSREANIMAVLWPERVKALVAVSGYLITNVAAQKDPLVPVAEYGWWYQYYFSTDRGRIGYDKYRDAFNRLIWKNVSPKWQFDDATYNQTAQSFQNPDHVAIVIHNYRWRLGLAHGESKYDQYQPKLFEGSPVTVPTVTISSDFDGPNIDGAAYAKKYTGTYDHRILKGIGHNVPQEAPQAFADAIVAVDALVKGQRT